MDQDMLLIERILNGETSVFNILIDKYQHIIYGYLLKMSFSKEDAEDMTQEVFIKVYKNLYKFNGKCRLLTWIFKIAVNTFYSEYRNKKRKVHFENDDILAYLSCDFEDYPENALERKEDMREALVILNKLDFEQKNAVILRYIHNFSYKDIGHILGISEEAAKMKVYRAKKKICKITEQQSNKRGVLNEVEVPY